VNIKRLSLRANHNPLNHYLTWHLLLEKGNVLNSLTRTTSLETMPLTKLEKSTTWLWRFSFKIRATRGTALGSLKDY